MFQGAEYIFSCVWKYLQDKVFATPPGPPPTKRELHLAAHAAFRAARTEVYVDEQGCRDKVTKFVQGTFVSPCTAEIRLPG